MKKIIAALLLTCMAVPEAQAQGKCFSAEEVKAERLLRLHSEMMVVTVTCKRGAGGRDLIKAYTGFTKKNIEEIKGAESTLMHYYASTYGGDGKSRLDVLRTKLANEYSQVMAAETAPSFCELRRDKVMSLFDSPPPSIQDFSTQIYASALTYEPLCDKSLKVVNATYSQEKAASGGTKVAELKTKRGK